MRLKNLLFIFFFIVSFYQSFAQQHVVDEIYLFSFFEGNGEDGLHLAYSEDGYAWHELGKGDSFLSPSVGEDRLLRDPYIIRGSDGEFHMVWTVGWKAKGIGYASSPDLIHWSSQAYLPVMEHEPNARNAWAPEIFYDEEDEVYLIYWSTTISGLYPETQSNKENSYNHRLYYVITRDFKEFTEARLLYELGFNVIDGNIIRNGDDYLMFVKDETIEPTRKNIRISTSRQLPEGFGAAGPPITGGYWAEGPTSVKVGEEWVVYFDKYMNDQMGAVSSPDLVHWTDISEQVNFPKGVRHGSVLKITQTEFFKLKKHIELSNL